MTTTAPPPTHNVAPARQDFYRQIAPNHLAPLWEVLHGLVTAEPQTRIVPHLWAYDGVRPFLLEACELITAREAERRVLVLENPALPGESRITPIFYTFRRFEGARSNQINGLGRCRRWNVVPR